MPVTDPVIRIELPFFICGTEAFAILK